MANTIGRNLNLCFSKIMRPLSPESPSSTSQLPSISSTSSTSIPSSSSTLIKNFNSLYDPTLSLDDHGDEPSSSTSCDWDSDATNAPIEADLATAFASQRFFFSSPGRSNSIVESAAVKKQKPPSQNQKQEKQVFRNSVAVPTYSPDPYVDFRRSMQEMVEARPELRDVRSNWEILHELLLCYLALNPKNTHKYIVGAFADLLVTLMPSNADDVVAAR